MFTLPDLPYEKNALEPYMSSETFSFHHEKHHASYVNNLNNLLNDHENLKDKSLEDIIAYANDNNLQGVFNNAAQIWNHTFFWNSMKPNGGGEPSGSLLEKINADFGSFDAFTSAFKQAAATQFGSGWAWLVLDQNKKLQIVKTSNAQTPLTDNLVPLITLDVWEHAYYLDYQNKRPDFIATFLNNLVNWDFAEDNLKASL